MIWLRTDFRGAHPHDPELNMYVRNPVAVCNIFRYAGNIGVDPLEYDPSPSFLSLFTRGPILCRDSSLQKFEKRIIGSFGGLIDMAIFCIGSHWEPYLFGLGFSNRLDTRRPRRCWLTRCTGANLKLWCLCWGGGKSRLGFSSSIGRWSACRSSSLPSDFQALYSRLSCSLRCVFFRCRMCQRRKVNTLSKTL